MSTNIIQIWTCDEGNMECNTWGDINMINLTLPYDDMRTLNIISLAQNANYENIKLARYIDS